VSCTVDVIGAAVSSRRSHAGKKRSATEHGSKRTESVSEAALPRAPEPRPAAPLAGAANISSATGTKALPPRLRSGRTECVFAIEQGGADPVFQLREIRRLKAGWLTALAVRGGAKNPAFIQNRQGKSSSQIVSIARL